MLGGWSENLLRRIAPICFLALFVFASASEPLVWSKEILPTISYRQEIKSALPMEVHVVRFMYPSQTVQLTTALAGGKVIAPANATLPVSSIAKSQGALLAINADYFAPNGDPLGLFIHNGEFISEPFRNRSAIGWTEDRVLIDRPIWRAWIETPSGVRLQISGINRAAGSNELVACSESGGTATAANPGMMFVFDCDSTPSMEGTYEAKFKYVVPDIRSQPVEKGQWVIAATGTNQLRLLAAIQQNETYKITFRLEGNEAWKSVKYAIGGGPRLIREGRVLVEFGDEQFDQDLALKRHPRTAIGITGGGEIVLVVVDGRSKYSTGASLNELAWMMRGLGCVNAINLDGGGSSTLYVGGAVLNRPSDGKERRVANALLLLAQFTNGEPKPVRLASPAASVIEGETLQLRALGADDADLPPQTVIWVSETPFARVNQDGVVLAEAAGRARVRAIVHGASATIEFDVLPKPRASSGP
jgi:uncharacterized protein YigE (DUF2233 family)